MQQKRDEAQAKGEVPFDDDFDPFSVFADLRTGKRFPYWIAAAAQVDKGRRVTGPFSHCSQRAGAFQPD
jgi:hypothetical protein